MGYLNDNKKLLNKYILIIIFNIIISILCNYYFKTSIYKDLIILVLVVIVNNIIYYKNGIVRFKLYLDFIVNFIIGIVFLLFIKEQFYYSTLLFSIIFANNIVFVRSRISTKYIKRLLQYVLMFMYSFGIMFINLLLFLLLK